MQPSKRRQEIVSLVGRQKRISVEDLADRLGASRETVRRDLSRLEADGLVRRTHGFAVPGGGTPIALEGSFGQRMSENAGAKQGIARTAAALFASGASLFVDTGSTTIAFAEQLAQLSELTVITNSAVIAACAAKGSGSRVILLGGTFRRGGMETVGEMAIAQVRTFRTVHAVLTVGGVDAAGYSDFDVQEAEVARAMIAQAQEVTILADSSKMDRFGPFQLGGLAVARRIVTDALPSHLHAAARDAGVEVVLAESS